MQRLNNRSAHAPVGTAFFVFLGLAILPVSLRVAGVEVSFSPRLSAAGDAWQQIADVFGASYRPAPAAELAVVKDVDAGPSIPTESSVSTPRAEFACTQKAHQSDSTVVDVQQARAPGAAIALGASVKPEPRRPPTASRVLSVVAAEAIKASLEKRAPAIAALGFLKLETLTREQLVKSIEKRAFRQSFESIGEFRSPAVPTNVRMLVRLKRAAAGFSAKPAECKVFSALASTRKLECERAMLTSTPSSPDNSEF